MFLRKIFIYIFLVIGYGSLGIYSNTTCRNNKLSRKCQLSSKFVYPSRAILDGAKQTIFIGKNIFLTGKINTSGLLVNDLESQQYRFKDLSSGFTFNYPAESRKNAGYLLLSKPDTSNQTPNVEIWDLNKQKLLHKYNFTYDEIKKAFPNQKINKKKFRLKSPNLLSDGSILISSAGGKPNSIIKFDMCGKYLAHNSSYKFHHSLEVDRNGYIYSPIYLSRNIPDGFHAEEYMDDGFAILSKDLKVIRTFSMLDIYKKNGLISDIYGRERLERDPFHINDVQPYTRSDGTTILLVSMRNHSRLLAFDPSTSNVIWFIDRITSGQHDIDVIDQYGSKIDISIFDNNNYSFSGGQWKNMATSGNRVLTLRGLPIRFDKHPISISDKRAYEKYSLFAHDFKSITLPYRPISRTEGKSDFVIKNNSLMVEETNYGRLIEIELESNKVLWQYLNKSDKNTSIFMLSWSQRIPHLPGNLNQENFGKCIN